MKKRIHKTPVYLILLFIAFSSCQPGNKNAHKDLLVKSWYYSDSLARRLSQLDSNEVEFLDASPLISHKPVVLPKPELVVTGNDYFDWPIATQIDKTIILLYDRRHYHWSGDTNEPHTDKNSGIRMIIYSDDGGKTWSDPVDVLQQAGTWKYTIFGGWGGGLGVFRGIVYLVLNEGLYQSADKGRTWTLVNSEPDFSKIPGLVKPITHVGGTGENAADKVKATFWSPGLRLTFDTNHGLTIWSTRDFKPSGRDGKTNSYYGKYLCAIYSKDFGKTWQFEEQALPEGLYLSEITPLQFEGKLLFFLRNGINHVYYGQGYSPTGWFPIQFAITNIGPIDIIDTPGVIFNPFTGRLESTLTRRTYGNSDKPMEMQLYSISPGDLASGSNKWQFEGVLLRYKGPFGKSDGMNPVGGIVDNESQLIKTYVWGGNVKGEGGIFEYSRSWDTPELSRYLKESRE